MATLASDLASDPVARRPADPRDGREPDARLHVDPALAGIEGERRVDAVGEDAAEHLLRVRRGGGEQEERRDDADHRPSLAEARCRARG